MVQLKWSCAGNTALSSRCFNSCMVQLKYNAEITVSLEERCFNSCMVQLKFQQLNETNVIQGEF